MKHRLRTLMERRERKQLEREADSISHDLQRQQLLEKSQNIDTCPGTDAGNSDLNHLDEANESEPAISPLKGQIDLNIQPEREEDLSPGLDSGPAKGSLLDPTDRFCKQQRSLGSDVIGNLVGKKMQQDGVGDVSFVSCVALDDRKTGEA